ncbi:hypothetical protein PIB30_097891, partial [Stylosanthes scabra]|nr:hypothetical protein [Stylosanthes scabra]
MEIEELRQARNSEKPHNNKNDNRSNRPHPNGNNRDSKKSFQSTPRSKYCTFHQKHGHNSEDCVIANDLLERLARQGHLDKYIDGHIFKANKGSSSNTDKGKKHNEIPEITFEQSDLQSATTNLDDPVVISLQVGDPLVRKVLLDPGSSAE